MIPPQFLFWTRRPRRIIDINQRAKDTYGYEPEELIDTPFAALGDLGDDEIENALIHVAARRHSVLLSKKRHYRKGGAPFFVTIVVSAAEYGGPGHSYRQHHGYFGNRGKRSPTGAGRQNDHPGRNGRRHGP